MGNKIMERVMQQAARSTALGQSVSEWQKMSEDIVLLSQTEGLDEEDVFHLVDEALDAYEAAKA